MPSRLEDRFRARIDAGSKLLVPFLTAGFPDREGFLEAARGAARAGADALEVGIPFSDPLADGPTIQRASQRALERGARLVDILDDLERLAILGIPIIVMTYANPVVRMGAARFCGRAVKAGVAGVLVSDLPPGEMPDLEEELRRHGLARIVLVAPTTDPERIPQIAAAASGFVYCVTRTGVTGAGADFSGGLSALVSRVRACTRLPLLAGFGVRTAEDAARLRPLVDGVIVGARLIEAIEEGEGPIADRAASVLAPIRRALEA